MWVCKRAMGTIRSQRWPLLLLAGFTWIFTPVPWYTVARAQEEQGRRYDLKTLLERAEQRYPGMRAAAKRIEAARARLAEAWVSPYFQINVSGTFALSPEARGGPTFSPDPQLPLSNPWGPVYGVRAEGAIPLFTFGKLSAARKAADAGVDAARGQRRQALASLKFDLRRAYYSLQFALDMLQTLKEGNRYVDKALRRLEAMLDEDTGEVTEQDRWRLSTAGDQLEVRVSEARRAEILAREALTILSGIENIRVVECPLRPVPSDLETMTHYHDLARARPEVAMLQAAVKAREAQYRGEFGKYFPDLALALRASYSRGPGITDQNNPFIVDQANYQSLGAGLVARWSLDFLGNSQRVRRARAQLEETKAQKEEAERGIRLETSRAYTAVQDAKTRERILRTGVKDARAWFVSTAGAYEVGVLDPEEFVDAAQSYFTSRAQHLEAVRSLNVSMASLEQATGSRLLSAGQWEVVCTDPELAAPAEPSVED